MALSTDRSVIEAVDALLTNTNETEQELLAVIANLESIIAKLLARIAKAKDTDKKNKQAVNYTDNNYDLPTISVPGSGYTPQDEPSSPPPEYPFDPNQPGHG